MGPVTASDGVVTVEGTYGTIVLNVASGEYTYTFDHDDTESALTQGQEVQETSRSPWQTAVVARMKGR